MSPSPTNRSQQPVDPQFPQTPKNHKKTKSSSNFSGRTGEAVEGKSMVSKASGTPINQTSLKSRETVIKNSLSLFQYIRFGWELMTTKHSAQYIAVREDAIESDIYIVNSMPDEYAGRYKIDNKSARIAEIREFYDKCGDPEKYHARKKDGVNGLLFLQDRTPTTRSGR